MKPLLISYFLFSCTSCSLGFYKHQQENLTDLYLQIKTNDGNVSPILVTHIIKNSYSKERCGELIGDGLKGKLPIDYSNNFKKIREACNTL